MNNKIKAIVTEKIRGLTKDNKEKLANLFLNKLGALFAITIVTSIDSVIYTMICNWKKVTDVVRITGVVMTVKKKKTESTP